MTNLADPHAGESLPSLVRGLIDDISTLLRKEVALAKAEAGEKVNHALDGGKMIAIGAILLLGALGVLLAAAVTLLGALFVGMGMDPLLANSLSALIVAAIVGIIGWSMVNGGINRAKKANLNMERTTASLSSDAAVIKERV